MNDYRNEKDTKRLFVHTNVTINTRNISQNVKYPRHKYIQARA